MIEALTGQALIDTLGGITSEMSGKTLNDVYDQLMTDTIDLNGGPSIGVGNWTGSTPAISGDTNNSVVDSNENVAVDAWHDYVENEVTVVSPITGGIVSGSDVETLNYSILEDSNHELQAVTPVAIPMSQATVAIAQALGVSVDWNRVNDDIKTGFNNALSAAGCKYNNAEELVAAWWDGVHILFPKIAIDAIQDFLDEEGIGPSTEYKEYTDPTLGEVYTFTEYVVLNNGVPYQYYVADEGTVFWRESLQIIRAIKVNGTGGGYTETTISTGHDTHYNLGSTTTTPNGNTTQGRQSSSLGGSFTSEAQISSLASPLPSGYTKTAAAADIIADGQEVPQPGGFPEGTEESQAPSYTPSTIPTAGGIASSSTETVPVVPINLPENPTDTTESTVDPISATDDDTVSDLPAPPIPLPIPDTNVSNPDVPLVNPTVVDSTLINELVEELANTLDPQAPQSSGIIPVPLLPGVPDGQGGSSYPSIVPASGSGLIHVYNPTPGEFVSFGNWLWVTYADATIDKIWNNPFDGIIGAHELYATPQTDGSDNIRSGFLVCPTTAALVRQRYTEIDCGTIIVPEFYGNYLDYSPYSQAYIYLPFIGINEVSIDDIVGHAINIRYRVDAYNGSCIAMIFVAKDGYQNLCYQFAGNCAVEVPLAGGSQAAIKAGVMQAEAYARSAMIQAGANLFGGIGSALMGNLGGILSSMGGIASAYGNAQAGVEAARVANKSSVQHSGQFGASHGAMGEKIPFIIIRNPIQVKVVNYNEEYGFPAHKRVIIGGCRGYLRVREVNVISAHATDEEKMAIELALKNGVYVS